MRRQWRIALASCLMLLAPAAGASVSVTVNGQAYTIPQKNEKGWGDNVTSWIQAISANTIQPTGGLFTLSADLNLGPTFGLVSKYYKTGSSNIASAGAFRLSNTDAINWRNNANSADIGLGLNTSDQLTLNGNPVLSSTALSVSKALASDSAGMITASAVTATELGRLSGVGSSVLGKDDSGTVTNKTIAAGSNTISGLVNANLSGSAAISNANLATMATKTYKGNTTGGSATPTDVAASTVLADISPLTTKGDVLTFSSVNARLGVGSDGAVLTADSAQTAGIKWATPVAAPSAFYEASNLSVTATVAANALTVALKDGAGSDPSSGSAAKIGFRSSTATSGAYNQRSVTGALSVVVPSTTTIGTSSGVPAYIYVYALDNAGTVELAVSLKYFSDLSVQSSSAISGGSSATTLYSTAARTGVPIRFLGRITVSEATAGTWASAPTEVSLGPIKGPIVTIQRFTSGSSATYTTPAGVSYIKVRMIGGGGGGSGSGSTAGTPNASPGNDTTFGSLLTAKGGASGGTNQGGLPGNGGAAGTVSAPAITLLNIPGGGGGGGGLSNSATTYAQAGGIGGSGCFGGGGKSGTGGSAGGAGATNSGAGGGGGAGSTASNVSAGHGGGSGNCVEAVIPGSALAASYTFTVGTGASGGSNGTSGQSGGAGADGVIVVEEYSQ